MRRIVGKSKKKHVLSFRVEEADWLQLKKVSGKTGEDISTLLRNGLQAALRGAGGE